MVPGIEVLGEVGIRILANLGKAVLERWKQRKRELEDTESSDKPIRVSSQELEEPENLAKILERVERLEQRQEDERLANVLSVLERTVEALADKEVPGQQPDSRWVSVFTECAQHASTDELRDTWARILAGETERPGTISARTLSVLDGLDQSTALLFRRLCSMAISVLHLGEAFRDCRVPSLGKNAGNNALRDYGVGFDELNVLNEHGLIIPDYNSWFDYRNCIARQMDALPVQGRVLRATFRYQSQEWGLVPTAERDPNAEFRVSGVSLTRTGRELSKVVELLAVTKYDKELADYFAENSLRMERITGST